MSDPLNLALLQSPADLDGPAARLEWLTGFSGSAGVAVVLAGSAAILVDGRYTLQVRQQVDLAGGQRGKAGFTSGRHVFDLVRISENGCCDGAADCDVKAFPLAVGVRSGEADQTG